MRTGDSIEFWPKEGGSGEGMICLRSDRTFRAYSLLEGAAAAVEIQFFIPIP